MTAVPPINIFGGCQTQEGLIHQRRWLEGVSRPLTTEAFRGDPAQIRHQQFEQPGFGLCISSTPLLKQLRDFALAGTHGGACSESVIIAQTTECKEFKSSPSREVMPQRTAIQLRSARRAYTATDLTAQRGRGKCCVHNLFFETSGET